MAGPRAPPPAPGAGPALPQGGGKAVPGQGELRAARRLAGPARRRPLARAGRAACRGREALRVVSSPPRGPQRSRFGSSRVARGQRHQTEISVNLSFSSTMLLGKLIQPVHSLKKLSAPGACRHLWGWLNAVFNKVDYERIQAVGPDRAASEWLLRCGALVRFQGYDKWQHDYNGLPTGPLGKYKIQAIDATESCIMYRGFDYLDGLRHVEEIKLSNCIYIQDECLQRISETESLQKSLLRLMIISCGNVTDKGIIALHKLTNLEYLFLSDLPGIREKETTVQILKKSKPSLELELDLE
ncbi:unnamed protein product [Caretta caretta]